MLTSPSAHNTSSDLDGAAYELVFSDEFETPERSFADGEDPRWTALQLKPSTNQQINFYNASLASTRNGVLELRASSNDIIYKTYVGSSGSEGGAGGSPPDLEAPAPAGDATAMAHLQTAMLQTWGKFCFQDGIAEISAKMPGRASQMGLWPAFWLMGQLGRATYQESTSGLWPWTFDECVEPDSDDCAANQCTAQRVSKCKCASAHT